MTVFRMHVEAPSAGESVYDNHYVSDPCTRVAISRLEGRFWGKSSLFPYLLI